MKKTAYITGADRGLGLALTKVFLQKDYKVFAGRYMQEWLELDELKNEFGDDLDIITLDVNDQQSVDAAANYIKDTSGQLDILVNNAAIYKDRSEDIFGEFHYDDMRKLFETNVFGPLRVSKSVIPLLMKGKDKMLANISSEAASLADSWRKKEYGYSMSKTALNMQLTIMQNQLEEHDIKVLAFHPGYVRTYIFGEFNPDATIDAIESASGIVEQILKFPSIDEHMYIDYQGNKMNW
ncbi:SDR family NAD(P)-dependent oxidoreductase [Aquibacillus koreensis]|uniref:SDR family NAD(P)-dependent oxidoreductase n=1 Tax=Aquibacillus koreensis TaxID=279446 RepID=A0A9X4AIR6_9BACI|nr:SDR family NAD(P)-dependent oxidoreductase [Aquibacillus koreensis]MCT2535155.1 SDR family NAD(P)-dependent oxidoreductase [Aquibacillus koreensis]MDC3421014.1 SDR family NAD(P)-dependent oxidoreductase [Aquibacillus koreensis]